MYVDKELLLSDSQDLEMSQGTTYSTNAIDLESLRDIGKGRPISMVITVDEAFTSAGLATVVFFIVDEDTESDGTVTLDSDSVEIVQTDTLAIARLTEGKVIVIPIPAGLITKQYIGMKYTIGTADTTAGKVSVFLALDAQTN